MIPRTLLSALLLPCAAGLAGSPARPPAIVDGPAYARPQRLVEIEPGRRMNLYCVGQGRPTVILESGLDSPTLVWGLVQPALAGDTRVCAYDHAGIGFSDASPRASTAADFNDDLHRMLAAARIVPPYVLVGASAGGLYSRLYTFTFPDEIAGLVFVDSSHEKQRDEWRKFRYPTYTAEQFQAADVESGLAFRRACIAASMAGQLQAGTEMFGKCVDAPLPQLSPLVQKAYNDMQSTPQYQRAWYSEFEAFMATSSAQVRAARRPLGDLPLIALARDRTPPVASATAEQKATSENWYRIWLDLQRDLAGLSSRGQMRVVAGAGHDIELDRPQAVIDAVREVLAAARRR